MKKFLFLYGLLLFISEKALATDEYAVSKIAPHLLKNANAVLRKDIQIVELQSVEKIVMKQHYVITILNEQGERFAGIVESYDRFNSIESIEGALYDAFGKKIKTLKKADVKDESANSGMSLAEDMRVKSHNFFYKVYPYTVEYIVEKTKKETMFFPRWIPLLSDRISVEQSGIQIKVPEDYVLRYKTFNYDKEPVVNVNKGRKEYTWEVTNLKAEFREPLSPTWLKVTPSVMFAPSAFKIENYQGVMTNWAELGLFQTTLNKGRDILPENIKKKVLDIVSNCKSSEEKIFKLYNFLQSSTRYVSIQLGIGGWRPFEAGYVAANAYGDCKALSNYMNALLKEAGIKSYYTLIKAGDDVDDIVTDFPSRQFNHAILCVPDGADTIWLECTDQNKSAGYMGGFTGNRHALLITEEGGKLVQTPTYGAEENLQIRSIKAVVGETGDLNVKIASSYQAMQQDDLHLYINSVSKDKVKEWLQEVLDFATYEINNFSYKEKKGILPVINETLDISVSHYATITGKRLFITPNIMSKSFRKLSVDTTRKNDIELGYAYKDIDTVEIELPKGYEPEAMSRPVSISSQFGKYSNMVKLDGNKLIYYRSIEQYSGRFPAKEYADLVKYYDAVYKADRSKVVLVKNEQPLKGF